jgi:hypothetical protein
MTRSGFAMPPMSFDFGSNRTPSRIIANKDTRRFATPSGSVDFDAALSREAPRIPWEEFVAGEFSWGYGEHVGLIGVTGGGKTTLMQELLPLHPYVVVFATKPQDRSMERLVDSGYVRIPRWASVPPQIMPRRVLWPSAKEMDSDKKQREVFHAAFQKIYRETGWTVAIDELWYFINVLKLGKDVETYLSQARSLDISLIIGTQRPAYIPLMVYDQSTHLFFWRDNDERNLSRLSGISWRSSNLIRHIIANLEPHQVLYVNTRTGKMFRTRVPAYLATKAKGGEK